jgi:hypothetical protein
MYYNVPAKVPCSVGCCGIATVSTTVADAVAKAA